MNIDDMNRELIMISEIKLWELRVGSVISNADDFLRGQRDCQEGVYHQSGESEDYDRGYCAQYTHEQNMSRVG